MSHARPIGELVAPIMAHCVGLQPLHLLLRTIECPCSRKTAILNFYSLGSISREDAGMLIEAYQLETA